MSISGNDPYSKEKSLDRERSQTQKLAGNSLVINTIRKQSVQDISQFVSQLFDSCDDVFYDLSNNANSNQEQALYFDSMREIRLKRQVLQQDYLAQINAVFQKLISRQPINETSATVNKLSIVKNDELEIDVALTNMSTRTNNAYSEEIYNLQIRLNHLLKDINTAKENNPLAPELICRLFANTCKAHLEISIKPLIILLKQFERFVLEPMGKTYAEVNELLIKAGICPKIPRKVSKENGSLASNRKNPNSIENTVDGSVTQQNRYNIPLSQTYEDHNHQLSLEAFKTLFTNVRSSNAKPSGFRTYSNNSGPLISLSQLANLLNQAQGLVDRDSPYDVEKPHLHDVTSKLLSAQSSQGPQAVSENEENIINLVAMFFEFILDDSSIALKLRNQISRLQIPVLKLALQDDTFFSNPSHPARHLINTIAAIGVIYDDNRDLNKDKIYHSVVDIVKTICHQYEFDNRIFAELFPQLEKVIEKERLRSATIEKRTAQTEIGKSKVKAANKTARVLLVKKLHNIQLPSAARDFLIDCWLNVMIMTLLKFSEQSKEWGTVVQTVDDFLWCCQGKKGTEALQRLQQLQPKLLKQIGVGLDLLGKHSDSIKEELARVKNIIKESKESIAKTDNTGRKENTGVSAAADKIIDLRKASHKPKTAIARQQQERSEISYKTLQQVNDMKVGDWIKYRDEKTGETIRCKLLTKIKSTNTFLFVNRLGVKVLEKNRRAVAHYIQQGSIKIIDNAPLFERTLARVFTRLKQASPKK